MYFFLKFTSEVFQNSYLKLFRKQRLWQMPRVDNFSLLKL